jgi:hypothetical protein
MLPINLRVGQSTILRFVEKPKKVVLGNSNYYAVEYIDNDIAIQPFGGVTTNLFVYGNKKVYGFLLRSNQITGYDDLVEVDLEENKLIPQVKPVVKILAFKEVSKPNIKFLTGDNLKVTIFRIQRLEQKNFYIFDLLLDNTSVAEADLSKIEINLAHGNLKLSPQEFVIQQEKLKSGETTKVRIFALLSKHTDLLLGINFKGIKKEQIILRKFL